MYSRMVAQTTLFDQYPNEDIGDLVRIKYALENLGAEALIDKLESDRGHGRNDYPVGTMFAIVVSQFVVQRLQVAQMRRELSGNPTLRKLVKLNDYERQMLRRPLPIIPTNEAFTHFYDRLIENMNLIEEMFYSLRDDIYRIIPNFGMYVAGDGKYFDSYTPNMHHGMIAADRRAEHDATYSKKVYTYTGTDGNKHSKTETHYGFRKHTLVDTETELPIASVLTPANVDEKGVMSGIIDRLPENVVGQMRELSLDRGYDSTKLIEQVRHLGIIPIVDKRLMKKGNPLKQYKNTQFYYDDSGFFFFYDDSIDKEGIDEETGHPFQYLRARYIGYDKVRECMRYEYGDQRVRVYIKDDPRTFNQIARDSEKYQREYNRRTSVERYHGRLDRDFCFETHTIRNIDKMQLMALLADCIILALAKAHHNLGQTNYAAIMDFCIPGL